MSRKTHPMIKSVNFEPTPVREVTQNGQEFTVWVRRGDGTKSVTAVYQNAADMTPAEARDWFRGYARDFLGYNAEISIGA